MTISHDRCTHLKCVRRREKTIMEAAKKDVFLLRGQWPYSRSSWRLVPWRSSEEHLFMSAVTPMHSTPSATPPHHPRAGLPLSQFACPPYLLPGPLSLQGNNIISAAGTCASCLRVSLLVSDSHQVDGQPERLHPHLKIDSASKGNNDSVLVSRTHTEANGSEQRQRETSLTVTFECNK